MGIIAWIVFGALAGWVASIVGAVVGGFLFRLLTGRADSMEFTLGSFVVAVGGALVLLFILRLVRRA
jgi:uncharacterized membrane protein YeaQ/YmgE (transglycosylase-associated protein family)